jgi:hypothetical protein
MSRVVVVPRMADWVSMPYGLNMRASIVAEPPLKVERPLLRPVASEPNNV